MGIHEPAPLGGWSQVWEGEEPTADLAERMLHGNGLQVTRRGSRPIRLFVPEQDEETARELLRDWGI